MSTPRRLKRIHVSRVSVAGDNGKEVSTLHCRPPRSHSAINTILGLDLGKFKSVICAYQPKTQEAAYRTISTDPLTLRAELQQIRPDLVVVGTCTIAGWVSDVCGELDLRCLVVEPMNEAWRWSKVKRKTDRDDALKLARMAALGELPTAYVPGREARQRRGLVAFRHRLVGRRTAIQKHVRTLPGADAVKPTKCFLEFVG